jgi:Stress responsive A/B Barrel Domain
MKSRRKFIQTLTLASAASLVPIHLTQSQPMATQKIIHQVYFWLHNESDITEFLTDAVPMLGRCKDVTQFYQGIPAPTEKREVVDHSFHVSCSLFFDSLEGQAAYQKDPLHLAFIAKYASFWKTVKVYDILL